MVLRSPAFQPQPRARAAARAAARAGLLTGAVLYAWTAGGLEQNTWAATAAIVLPGVVGVWVARRRPPSRPPSRPGPETARAGPRGGMVWALWLLAFLLWEAGAFVFQVSPTIANFDHPTLSALLEPVLEPQPVRALGYLAWLAGGWRLLRR